MIGKTIKFLSFTNTKKKIRHSGGYEVIDCKFNFIWRHLLKKEVSSQSLIIEFHGIFEIMENFKRNTSFAENIHLLSKREHNISNVFSNNVHLEYV